MIQSGTIFLGVGADASKGWQLHLGAEAEEWQGQEERSFRADDIQFATPFATSPTVLLSLAGLDAEKQFNLRVRLSAEDVQPEEFNIRVITFGDSLLYAVHVAWIAYD